MNSTRKQYKIDIFGENYTLISDETEEHVKKSAQHIDLLMKEIASKMPIVNNQKTAVLAALQLASDLVYLKKVMETNEARESTLAEKIEKVLTSFSS